MVERYCLRRRVIFGVGSAVLVVLVVFFMSTRETATTKFKLQVLNRSVSTKKYVISETKQLSVESTTKPKPIAKSKLQILNRSVSTKKYVISETKQLSVKSTSKAKPIRKSERCSSFDKTSSKVKNTTRKGCSVPIFKSTDQRDYYSRNSSCPKCTSALFKDYYRTHKAFIADGYWDVLYSGNKINDATFRPPFCSFTRRNLDPDYSGKCFSRKRIRKIVAIGNSIGQRTFTGVKAILASTGIKQCQQTKGEKDGFFADIKYYLPNATHISKEQVRILRRRCHSCDARQFRCFYENKNKSGIIHKTPIILEFLTLAPILDNTVRILNITATFRPNNYTSEFLFRDYLGATGQPDVLIVTTPFLHEIQAKLERHGKAGLKGAIRKLVTILERYLPMSTEVYWVPSHYVFGGSEFNVTTVSQCNQDLYDELKAVFRDKGSRMYGTFDMLRLSCPLVDLSISSDPVHMQPKWYEVIGKHIVQLICN